MGALVSRALRPIKSFNIENRAHRIISKEKPSPAPTFPSAIEDLKRAKAADPLLDEKLDRKNLQLDERLKDVYVTSFGKPEDDITKERKNQSIDRPLPQDRKLIEEFDFGLKEPEVVPYGKTTLRHAVNFISSHQVNPEEITAAKIGLEYKLKEEDVETILKYFKTFEVYVSATKESPAKFAGPVETRKKLMKNSVLEIEDEKKSIGLKQSSQVS